MGVFPTCIIDFLGKEGLPHARGGVSHSSWSALGKFVSSPRTWGCFYQENVFRVMSSGLPHARGGVSVNKIIWNHVCLSSPRTWGCFSFCESYWSDHKVFPTHVGVFLKLNTRFSQRPGLPHARGGVSLLVSTMDTGPRSSPRTWGCFSLVSYMTCLSKVFPTHVGVFLKIHTVRIRGSSLPHARGGVSPHASIVFSFGLSSPRTWGCFQACDTRRAEKPVFPTHVGVFLTAKILMPKKKSLPHARGGVSCFLTQIPKK